MKIVGIVGGIAPESTIDYYRSIIAAYRARVADGSYPQVLVNSMDLTGMLALIADRAALTNLLVGEVERLARAGADLAVMASNTPHLVFEEVSVRSPIPMISIVESTCSAARAKDPLALRSGGKPGRCSQRAARVRANQVESASRNSGARSWVGSRS